MLELTMESAKGGSTWHLRGALTGPSCELVRAASRRLSAGRDLLLDCRDVRVLDRPGFGALLAAVARTRGAAATLAVALWRCRAHCPECRPE